MSAPSTTDTTKTRSRTIAQHPDVTPRWLKWLMGFGRFDRFILSGLLIQGPSGVAGWATKYGEDQPIRFQKPEHLAGLQLLDKLIRQMHSSTGQGTDWRVLMTELRGDAVNSSVMDAFCAYASATDGERAWLKKKKKITDVFTLTSSTKDGKTEAKKQVRAVHEAAKADGTYTGFQVSHAKLMEIYMAGGGLDGEMTPEEAVVEAVKQWVQTPATSAVATVTHIHGTRNDGSPGNLSNSSSSPELDLPGDENRPPPITEPMLEELDTLAGIVSETFDTWELMPQIHGLLQEAREKVLLAGAEARVIFKRLNH